MLTKNVGNTDRVVRIVLGLALAFAAFRASGPAVYVLGAASFVAVVTGLTGWCGLYSLLGFNTCKIDPP